MSEGAIVTRPHAVKVHHRQNILLTLRYAPSRPTTPAAACALSDTLQAIVFNCFSSLPRPALRASLSCCGAIRAQTRMLLWRDREEQRPKNYTWSPMRPASRRCQPPLHPTHVWSTSSASWHGKPREILFKPKRMDGSTTGSPNKEANL